MNIRSKIILLLGTFVLVSLVLVIAQYIAEQQRTQLLLNGVRTEEQAFFSSVVDLSGSNVAVFVSDYTFWDDMVDFVHEPTQEFIDEYLLISLDTYGTDRIYVYDADGKIVYAYRNGDTPAALPDLPPDAFDTFRAERQSHFYLIEDGMPIEYHAATIHPTDDPGRRTEPQGFLIVGNAWNPEYVATLEELSGATIGDGARADSGNSVSFPYEVTSWDKSVAASFVVSTPVPILGEAAKASVNQLYVIIGSLVLLLGVTFVFLQVFIGKPLETLSESIKRKDFRKLTSLEKSTSEFGELARVVIGFSEHELVLEGKAKDDAILSAVGSGLVVVDTEGHITLLNATAEKLLGISAAQALHKSANSVFRAQTHEGEEIPDERLPLARALAERTMQTDTVMCVRADGTTFPAIMKAAPVLLDGAVIGAVQDFRDITEEEAVERAKSDFVSLVSHELRTPLTLLRWSVETMQAQETMPKELLSSMVSAITRMRTLISAILDVSRIEAGTFAIGKGPIAIGEITSKILDELKPFVMAKRLSVHTQVPPQMKTMYSDERLFQIVVSSIITNAVKYSDEDGTVTVEVHEDPENLRIDVKNTGAGIPLEEQGKIFTKMFRAGNARLLNPDGTGLGLYISKSFVERLGGSLTFTSTPGEETMFTIRLPYGQA